MKINSVNLSPKTRLRPQIEDVGIVALVSDDWGVRWSTRHQVLTRLARYFNIVWVEPARGWREWLYGTDDDKPNEDQLPSAYGVSVYKTNWWSPKLYKPRFLAQFFDRARLEHARRILTRRGCSKIVLYLWRPEFDAALKQLEHDVSCYHIDDEYTFSEVEKELDEKETRLIRSVDQVIIHSPALMEKKGSLNPRTLCVSNGVDYRAYATPQGEPGDLKSIPHPRIGYMGVIKKQLDFGLLLSLAQRHPIWSFVFVGPRGVLGKQVAFVRELEKLPNVFFLGGKPVGVLPAYVQHFDVCTMCYELNDYTKYIYPLKLHEYLATGRPVVGTPIRSLMDFSHVVRLARTSEEWSKELTNCLTPSASSKTLVEARQAVAREYDWDRLAAIIARTICERLGGYDCSHLNGGPSA